jgi:hypothetical protein
MNASQDIILYRLIIQPISKLNRDEISRCSRAINTIREFSLSGREDNVIQYSCSQSGKTLCKLQITEDAIGIETSREGVQKESWNNWSNRILAALSSSDCLGWKGSDLAAFDLTHQYRFSKSGNSYEFLRDKLITGSKLCEIIGGLRLLDLTLQWRAVLEGDIQLAVNITSNQNSRDILQQSSDASTLIFEFHSLRTMIKSEESLLPLFTQQQTRLESWLEEFQIAQKARQLTVP